MQMAGFSILRRLRRIGCFSLNPPALCLLAIVLGVLGIHNLSIAEESPLQKRLANATVLREFDTKGAHVRQAIVAEDLAVFRLWRADSTVIVAYQLDGTELLCLRLPDVTHNQVGPIKLSEDGATLIITKRAGHESFKYEIFDILRGRSLFELNRSAYLRPSPSGRYFCNVWDEISEERLAIYDRLGILVKSFDKPQHSWDCYFLDDERLLVFDPDTVRFIKASTGDLIKVVPLGFGDYPVAPRIRFSRSDSLIAIYNINSLVLIGIDGEELWRDEFDDYLRAVAFDDRAPWLALQFQVPKDSAGYVKIVSVPNPAVTVRSVTIPSFKAHSSQTLDAFRLSAGVVMVWRPGLAIENFLRKDVDYQTLFMEFDPESMTISQPVTLRGLYRIISDSRGKVKYLRAQPRGNVTLLSVAKADREVQK